MAWIGIVALVIGAFVVGKILSFVAGILYMLLISAIPVGIAGHRSGWGSTDRFGPAAVVGLVALADALTFVRPILGYALWGVALYVALNVRRVPGAIEARRA